MGRDFWNVKAQDKVIKNIFCFLYMTQISPDIIFQMEHILQKLAIFQKILLEFSDDKRKGQRQSDQT